MARGFTYLLLLFSVALLGIGLAVAGEVWHTAAKREKEKELLFVGDAFREAIGNYYAGSPGGLKQFPAKLEDLLRDPRFPDTRRYLRTVYADPITGKMDWVPILAPQGGIMGVGSPSGEQPVKRSGFGDADQAFGRLRAKAGEKLRYSDWKFVYDPVLAGLVPNGGLM